MIGGSKEDKENKKNKKKKIEYEIRACEDAQRVYDQEGTHTLE